MARKPFRQFGWNYAITSGEKPPFNEHDGKGFLSNGLKFHMLSGDLPYWKQNFPQERLYAHIYQILNVLLYTNRCFCCITNAGLCSLLLRLFVSRE